MDNLTPMMKQYIDIKKQYSDSVLLFRLGDFYEMFFDDAKEASKILNIALTSRDGGRDRKVPMCGIPHHASSTYIAKLIRSGKKVAICEQVEDPKLAKGIVKRKVIQQITPGTVLDSNILDAKNNNYIVALNPEEGHVGLAAVDVSTGEFLLTELEGKDIVFKLENEFAKYQPSECIIPDTFDLNSKENRVLKELINRKAVINTYQAWTFSDADAKATLLEHLKTHSLSGFGCENLSSGIGAAGALLKYLKETQQSAVTHINSIATYYTSDFMILDVSTLRNLEIVNASQGAVNINKMELSMQISGESTLLSVLDHTTTSMGARLLRNWLLHPLINIAQIRERQDGVEELLSEPLFRNNIKEYLTKISDIERIGGRIGCGSANARDLISLKQSLKIIPDLKNDLKPAKSKIIKDVEFKLDPMENVVQLIENSIIEEAPVDIKNGGIIKSGYSKDLDNLRDSIKGAKQWIAELQIKERKRTRISSLKVRFNTVFGYYIEISRANLSSVPEDYIRKQTLVNAERFITPELKEKEALVLGAEEKIIALEFSLFCDIRNKISADLNRLKETAFNIAMLDSLLSLAEVASLYNYVKPEISDDEQIEISDGRHPVVEKLINETFVPNDVHLDCLDNQILIITGPNMAGKSTYLRQVALIVIMAQIGSFVPAKSARIGIVDRIFTRIGASDSILKGESTFMVEMNECANILNNATPKSLIILDEVGRGTSTFDGISIAWAMVEYLHNEKKVKAKTLFATHYYELTELALTLPDVKNYNVIVREFNDHIVFLRKIVEGSADRSYGIQVARLAGIPVKILDRAKEVLGKLEEANYTKNGSPKIVSKDNNNGQLTIFKSPAEPLLEEIKEIDINSMTPMQALAKLQEIKERLKADS